MTIEPGAEIRFESNTGILVGYGYNGSLSAVGTETSPIVFTSNLTSPVPGSWKGIYFYTNTLDAKSILEYCIVEYAGRNIYFDDASPTIRRNIIKNASDSGIYIQYSGSNSAVIDCNNISDNKFGIYLNSAAPQIVNNNFVNNQTGLHNNSSGTVTALNNWWNNAGGPGVNSSNGVYGNVTYSPWLTAQSNCISDPGTDKGYLQVTITPQEAVTAGAQWCVSGTCYSSGAKAELSAGTYTVEFKTVSGWTKPANQSVTVTGGQTKAVAGAYTSSTSPKGYLQVTITPQDAVTAGAQWCVSGACYSSGTKTELSAGTYTVEFKAVSGWTKPANQSVSVTSGQTATLTGTYTKISGGGFVTRVLSCYTAGSKTTISLKTAPPTSTSSYAVEDTTPVNWTVSNISDSGTYDSVNRKVKYGPFFDSTARTLTYDVTPPAGETGDKTFTGTASADGVDSTVGGDSVISVCANNHPADTDKNFTLSISEVTAYGSAWKKGTTWTMPPNPIPISYLTRAGSLWKGGEKYKYNLASGEAPLCWINVTSAARKMSRSAASAAVSDMPEMYGAGETFTVSISVTPASDVTVYALEDAVPAGWTVSSIDNSGSFDTVNSKVKYGPFFDNTARTFTYQITPPATAEGAYTFAGSASFDGVDIAVTGVRTVSDGTVVEIKGDVNGDGKLDLKDAIYILQVIIGLR